MISRMSIIAITSFLFGIVATSIVSEYSSLLNADKPTTKHHYWQSFLNALNDAEKVVESEFDGKSNAQQAQAYVYLMHILHSGMAMYFFNSNPEFPRLYTPQDDTKKWMLDNPDAHYMQATISSDYRYKISGKRNSVHYLGFQITGNSLGKKREIISHLSGEDLHYDDDGSFEIILSNTPSSGNWMSLGNGAEHISIRQFFNDWQNEIPAKLHISRIDETATQLAPPNQDEIANAFNRLARFVASSAVRFNDIANKRLYASPANSYSLPEESPHGMGSKRQVYAGSHYDLASNEALLIEISAPDAFYWNIVLGNDWAQSADYQYRQSSLNGHQAVIDADGVFRAVISHQDPGLANWLDTAGRLKAPMNLRMNGLKEQPWIKTKVIAFAELDQHLPAHSKRLSPQQRKTQLANRAAAIAWRYNPSR